jgi:uncharacterized protein
MPPQKAELLRIHVSAQDRAGGVPLFEAMVARCREMGIAGATVFSGVEGYGETAEIHRPILIAIVDTAENIARLVPVLAEMMETGVMARSAVDMIRVSKPA